MVTIDPLPHRAFLLLPNVRVQNANAISSPLTWGFPSITAFTGLMTALERRLGPEAGIQLQGVGVVCHHFEAQVTTDGYTRAFHLTRNPVLQDGSTAAIVEEGRVHLEVSLVFDVRLADEHRGESEREALGLRVLEAVASMRVAGGSVMPPLPNAPKKARKPWLALLADDSQADEQRRQFRQLARRLMPGYALVSRDDLLQQRLEQLRAINPGATVLDAWLDLCCWTSRATAASNTESSSGEAAKVNWTTDVRHGWIVPIPVGYAALSPLQRSGSVLGARDERIPFRFVESVWSIGQWLSPHRLNGLNDFIWQSGHDHPPEQPSEEALYRCFIDTPATAAPSF